MRVFTSSLVFPRAFFCWVFAQRFFGKFPFGHIGGLLNLASALIAFHSFSFDVPIFQRVMCDWLEPF